MTPNFTLAEFIESETARLRKIDNTPPPHIITTTLQRTAEGMEKIRVILGGSTIRITSGYRCKLLNEAVGGSRTSQHLTGEACDFIAPKFGKPRQIVEALAPHVRSLGIDQIIFEGFWVHVSFTNKPRFQVLSFVEGKFQRGIT